MRKQVIRSVLNETGPSDPTWLNLEQAAEVELTSEAPASPIESALVPGASGGWRAAEPGPQTIRLRFDRPIQLRRIWLVFVETEQQRTQEFVLRWAADDGHAAHEVVRQQWNFSPPTGTREVEDYRIDLAGVTVLELHIVPDISGGTAYASLAEFRLA